MINVLIFFYACAGILNAAGAKWQLVNNGYIAVACVQGVCVVFSAMMILELVLPEPTTEVVE